MKIATQVIPSERAFGLVERDEWLPFLNKYHRMQYIEVVRQDAPAIHTVDLGPLGGAPLQIIGYVETDKGRDPVETVERLQLMANQLREVIDPRITSGIPMLDIASAYQSKQLIRKSKERGRNVYGYGNTGNN